MKKILVVVALLLAAPIFPKGKTDNKKREDWKEKTFEATRESSYAAVLETAMASTGAVIQQADKASYLVTFRMRVKFGGLGGLSGDHLDDVFTVICSEPDANGAVRVMISDQIDNKSMRKMFFERLSERLK